MNPPTLFDQPRHVDTLTSRQAAESIKPTAANYRDQVYRVIRDHGPLSDEAIASRLNMAGNTERPRRRELQQMDRIRPGAAPTITHSGRKCLTWEIVPEPHQEV